MHFPQTKCLVLKGRNENLFSISRPYMFQQLCMKSLITSSVLTCIRICHNIHLNDGLCEKRLVARSDQFAWAVAVMVAKCSWQCILCTEHVHGFVFLPPLEHFLQSFPIQISTARSDHPIVHSMKNLPSEYNNKPQLIGNVQANQNLKQFPLCLTCKHMFTCMESERHALSC